MDRNAEMEASRDLMLRIIALLLSLADLAEHAAVGPAAMRREMLGALRRGGASAWRLAAMASRPSRAECDPVDPSGDHDNVPGDDPADAMRLAMCFRAVALLLARLHLAQCDVEHCALGSPRHLQSAAKPLPAVSHDRARLDLTKASSLTPVGATGPPTPLRAASLY